MKRFCVALILWSVAVTQAADKPVMPKPPPVAASAAKPSSKGELIAIKGMFIGMTTAEFTQLPTSEQTIGGVASKYEISDPFKLDWNEGRLESLMFFFKPDGFSAVLGAVRGKYPGVKCVESKVTNRMGAAFQQVDCTLKQAGATLTLSRFVGDIETSALTLTSDEAMARRAKASKAREADI